VFWRNLTIIDPIFSGNAMSIRKNIDWRDGVFCESRRVGGLGIIDLDVQNKCLLSKWLFKLINEEGL
jgi:hypothetical protein